MTQNIRRKISNLIITCVILCTTGCSRFVRTEKYNKDMHSLAEFCVENIKQSTKKAYLAGQESCEAESRRRDPQRF